MEDACLTIVHSKDQWLFASRAAGVSVGRARVEELFYICGTTHTVVHFILSVHPIIWKPFCDRVVGIATVHGIFALHPVRATVSGRVVEFQFSILNSQFTKGETGPHTPELMEKWTQPPKPYTEATLLRAMETAGKNVEDEELRDLMKENGIGRPATRAEIIKTLYKRNYVTKVKKNLVATPTGIELIGLIREELLKSAELTGIWEKRLREIESCRYNAKQFIEELKQMVAEIVHQVMADNTPRHI